MPGTITERIAAAENLPSLPTVAVEVLKLAKKADASVDELANVIQNDPALTAKMLKVVNSSLFGITRKIASIKEAIAMLGMRSVKVMALSFSVVGIVGNGEGEAFDFEAYWRRSLTTAVAARLIGRIAAPRIAEEAFVAGLLSDIGMVAAYRCAPDLYKPVYTTWRKTRGNLVELETQQLGVTHAAMSRDLLLGWGLPDNICEAIGSHHGEGLSTVRADSRPLAKVVYSAALLADLFCGELPPTDLERVRTTCCSENGIEPAKLETVLNSLNQHVRDTASLLTVHLGETVQYAQLQSDAAMQLVQLSMQAEVDRAKSVEGERQARSEAQRLSEEKRAIMEVAATDGLTRVANRAAFDQRLEDELKRAAGAGQSLGVIMMDVDHFKKFNDTHGHQAGDEVLRNVASCMRDVVKQGGFVARYGGEEFAVIVANQAATQVRALAEEIRKAIETRPARHEGKELHVTASFGATWTKPQAGKVSPAQLVETADKQLYQAKRAGRNRVQMS